MHSIAWSSPALAVRYRFINSSQEKFRRGAERSNGSMENDLIAEILKQLPKAERFQQLRLKLQNDHLSEKEQQELAKISELREEANATRAGAVMKLAKLRGVSFSSLWKELVGPPKGDRLVIP